MVLEELVGMIQEGTCFTVDGNRIAISLKSGGVVLLEVGIKEVRKYSINTGETESDAQKRIINDRS